jgi:adenylyltransferase/sulfurtransferase
VGFSRARPPDAFSRQLALPQVGAAGQSRLAAARAVVIGCGGLGAPAATALAAAGVGQLTLVDDDVVEGSNLNRQTWFGPDDIGQRKVDVAARALGRIAPDAAIAVRPTRVVVGAGADGARQVVRGATVVLDCSDGLPTKFLLNDACVREDVPLVHAAATALSGQVLVVPGARGPCLRCLFEAPPARGSVPTCRTAGILGAVTGIVGNWMALEAIKLIVGAPDALVGRFLALELLGESVRTLTFARRADCGACGDAPRFDATRADDYEREPDCD